MIYVSSSCSKKTNVLESVKELAVIGIKNIELSGGTEYVDKIDENLLELKHKYNLNFLLHNYFPPPQKHFVLNLASINSEIAVNSINHLKTSISLSKKLGAKKYGFHAGFFIDPDVNELGKSIHTKYVFDFKTGESNFIKRFKELTDFSEGISLYIENNVFSKSNYDRFKSNPFMLTSAGDFNALQKKMSFNLLLDVAHLKVSSNSVNLNFEEQLKYLCKKTNYLHLSDNDGLTDSNQGIKKDSLLYEQLKRNKLKNKTISLEIYSGFDDVLESMELINNLIA